ncbi:nucleotidyl transferase AbiEii/AbiGii toxin family protein [Domibacillus indicus]|uniref:nucleotidyl transferase AbiEii/AbiGii toxin family protein n=1 Tax=Domibacillus indicus TaxID=1437523 RepID=UPI000617D8FF|nr:nucleotidyl transferase AbiEii/AbiGii toxin family protein [Domibacillus indicus]
MIATKTFEKEWINDLSKQFGRKRLANPELIEKVTKALHLLELLSLSDLDFIFKGGTSLLLLLNKVHRFSIDIDIIIERKKDETDIDSLLDAIVQKSDVFESWQENNRHASGIPKAHYKLFYNSALDPSEQRYILLDILFEENHYTELVDKEINCEFISYDEPAATVRMPSIDSILGDKLTAFAPQTTGIQYGKGKELEIIKQLFDIENLFNEMENVGIVNTTFRKFASQELVYREKESLQVDEVLLDIFYTSTIICAQGSIGAEEFKSLQEGISKITDYIFTRNYLMRDALVSAAKAAYLSQILLSGRDQIERFSGDKIEDWKIERPLNLRGDETKIWRPRNINNVKKTSPEAFFYLFKALEIHFDEVMV